MKSWFFPVLPGTYLALATSSVSVKRKRCLSWVCRPVFSWVWTWPRNKRPGHSARKAWTRGLDSGLIGVRQLSLKGQNTHHRYTEWNTTGAQREKKWFGCIQLEAVQFKEPRKKRSKATNAVKLFTKAHYFCQDRRKEFKLFFSINWAHGKLQQHLMHINGLRRCPAQPRFPPPQMKWSEDGV